jgi:GntR family transcriptional regulator / MocR family aminotransferase
MLLELDGKGPRYRQITRALLHAIQEGTLSPGARLPSQRRLAADLGCARNLVVLAYDQLIVEGYLDVRPRGGTFVSPHLPRPASPRERQRRSPAPLPPAGRARRIAELVGPARGLTARIGRRTIDFAYGIATPDALVVRRLARSFATALRQGAFGYGDPAGDFRLRQQVVDRLRGARGIDCSPSQVVVTNGTQQALDLCARLLLRPGDRAAVEDPGYEGARAAFAAAGAKVVPVAVDDEGLDPARLAATSARVVYVTPSHQFPTGAILSAPRRHALLDWARRTRAFVIEDDYDGDLRYQGQPLRALAGLDVDGNVIYCGTFSKSLFPSLRLAFLVLPSALAEAAVDAKWLADRGTSVLLQRVLYDLMATGEYERHLGRLRRRAVSRRDTLLRALTEHFGDEVEIGGGAAGLHVVAWLPRLDARSLDELVARASARGVGVYAVTRQALRPLRRAGLILGYGLTDESAIERGVRLLAEAYGERGRKAR